MHEPRWTNTQMFYSRSPTNNILTSLRILSGDGRLGGGVFVKHLCPALWMKGTANPGTYTPAGLARPYYFRIGATWCITPTAQRDVSGKNKYGKMSSWHECVFLFIVFHLPLAGDAAAPMFLLRRIQTWLAPRSRTTTSAGVLAATPLGFSWRCKDRLFSHVSLQTENYSISPKVVV